MKHDLTQIYKMTKSELHNYVLNYIRPYGIPLLIKDNYYIVSIPDKPAPFICSHLDTKNNIIPSRIEIDGHNHYIGYNEFNQRCILGADDRNGVVTALELYSEHYNDLGFIFSWEEEVGCLGSKMLIDDYIDILSEKAMYFIQIDRKNIKDLAYYVFNGIILINNEFENKLKMFNGFDVVAGTSTDIKHLAYHANKSGINLSAGYYNEHTNNECSDIDYVNKLPYIVNELINHLGYSYYPLERV